MSYPSDASKPITYAIENASESEATLIYQRLMSHNAKICHTPDGQNWEESIPLIAKDSSGNPIGGALGLLYLEVIFIDVLWVDERYRGSGIGSQLIKFIESIASKRHCKMLHVNTLSVQAPEFYQKQGFEVFAELEGYPHGIKSYFLKKMI